MLVLNLPSLDSLVHACKRAIRNMEDSANKNAQPLPNASPRSARYHRVRGGKNSPTPPYGKILLRTLVQIGTDAQLLWPLPHLHRVWFLNPQEEDDVGIDRCARTGDGVQRAFTKRWALRSQWGVPLRPRECMPPAHMGAGAPAGVEGSSQGQGWSWLIFLYLAAVAQWWPCSALEFTTTPPVWQAVPRWWQER